MADIKGKILTAEEEQGLLKPIDEFVGGIQEEINALRADGTDRVTSLTNHIAIIRENANYTKAEKAAIIAKDKAELQKAKQVEKQHSAEIKKLIDEAVGHLDAHYDSDYYAGGRVLRAGKSGGKQPLRRGARAAGKGAYR